MPKPKTQPKSKHPKSAFRTIADVAFDIKAGVARGRWDLWFDAWLCFGF